MKVTVKEVTDNGDSAIAKHEVNGKEEATEVDHATAIAGCCLNMDDPGSEAAGAETIDCGPAKADN